MRSRRPIHINFSLRGMYMPSDCLCLPMICCMTGNVGLLKALVIDVQIMQFWLKENDNYPPTACIEVVVVFIQMSETAVVCSLNDLVQRGIHWSLHIYFTGIYMPPNCSCKISTVAWSAVWLISQSCWNYLLTYRSCNLGY